MVHGWQDVQTNFAHFSILRYTLFGGSTSSYVLETTGCITLPEVCNFLSCGSLLGTWKHRITVSRNFKSIYNWIFDFCQTLLIRFWWMKGWTQFIHQRIKLNFSHSLETKKLNQNFDNTKKQIPSSFWTSGGVWKMIRDDYYNAIVKHQ